MIVWQETSTLQFNFDPDGPNIEKKLSFSLQFSFPLFSPKRCHHINTNFIQSNPRWNCRLCWSKWKIVQVKTNNWYEFMTFVKKIKSLGYKLSTVFNQFVLRNYLLNQIVLPRMVFQTTEEFWFHRRIGVWIIYSPSRVQDIYWYLISVK